MIVGTSLQTTDPNIEEMFVSGSITGDDSVVDLVTHISYSDLTASQKTVYDSAISIVGGKYYNTINNTTASLIIDRVTSSVLTSGENITDFNALSSAEKDKLRALLSLFIELKN